MLYGLVCAVITSSPNTAEFRLFFVCLAAAASSCWQRLLPVVISNLGMRDPSTAFYQTCGKYLLYFSVACPVIQPWYRSCCNPRKRPPLHLSHSLFGVSFRSSCCCYSLEAGSSITKSNRQESSADVECVSLNPPTLSFSPQSPHAQHSCQPTNC